MKHVLTVLYEFMTRASCFLYDLLRQTRTDHRATKYMNF